MGPARGDVLLGLVSEHVVTRSVRDSAAVLDIIAGHVPGDPYAAPAPQGRFADAVAKAPGKLRIAVAESSPIEAPVHPDCIAALREARKLVESLGHITLDRGLAIDGEELVTCFSVLWLAQCAEAVESLSFAFGVPAAVPHFEPLTLVLADLGRRHSARELLRAHSALQRMGRAVTAQLADVDVWMTPTLAQPPLPLGSFDLDLSEPLDLALLKGFHFTPFTQIANLAGLPAMSVPLGRNKQGLPIGIHFMGHYGSEELLFQLAGQLERTPAWKV